MATGTCPDVLKGHGFSRAEKGNKTNGALAPEGHSFGIDRKPKNLDFEM
jgi:hypothetical protein